MVQIVRNELDFIYEANRLGTYKNWIFSNKHSCNAAKMAEAGWIFIGNKNEQDSVKCFLCEKTLVGWESDDDPWKEHLKHSSHCKFVLLKKAEIEMTLQEFMEMKYFYKETLVRKYYDKRIKDLDKMSNNTKEMLLDLK